ncbi:hypothetical protein GDO86_010757 [Hymenochirus boettgeri]|uniref:Fibrocystin-L n=1 Tax=Hymenochirus boettgeri TaxID=247094 RepID=A0A8T2JBG1_9PIPI|nr:hypothetical protein GDO86_010757 [Hymenochirus boettgeri]
MTLVLVIATAGSLITIRGKIFTDVFGSNTALSSNGRNVRVLRVYAGGMPCELLVPNSDTLYGLQLDTQYSDMGTMICKNTGTYIGHLNISFILDSSFGRSLPSLDTYFVSSGNKLAMFQTYVEITGIYPSIGSIQGGAIITITGRFFDETDSPARVLVGGQDCKILGLTDSTITCQAPPLPNVLPSLFPGSRGLKFETWNSSYYTSFDQALSFNESTTGYNGASWVSDASIQSTQQDFIARLSGFLVPTQTDDYGFYIKGDDNYMLFFSETGNPADKAKVAKGWETNSYFSYTNQKSELFRLQKGKPYYIEIYLQQYGGPAALDVGLYQRSSDYSDVQTPDAVMDVQRIQAQTTVSVEQQVITLQNWNSSTAVMEVQTITVTKFCDTPCPGLVYKLIYGCEKTDFLSADASAVDVQSALNNLWSLKPDTVQVNMMSLNDQNIYNVTFNSQRGDFQLLSYEVPDGINITVDVEEQEQGISDMSTFTLVWDCVYSRPLASNASAAEVNFAIEEMLSSLCPDVYVNYKENFAVKVFRNYETDFTPENLEGYLTSTETPAFCGRYSLKNPQILYNSSDLRADLTPYGLISLSRQRQMCFAYKGGQINQIGIGFQYESNGGVQNLYNRFSYNFPQSDSWTYICIDLLAIIKATYPGKNYYVNDIQLYAVADFYIDVLYIGQTATTNNPDAVRREPVLANRGIMISGVSVASLKNAFSQYTVTITPSNCGYNIPLMSVGFAAEKGNNRGDSASYRANSWPGNAEITINRTQIASPPIGGTFNVQAYGKQTADLLVNMSNTDLQYALQTIPELGQVSVSSETRSCDGYSWQVKFQTTTGYQPLLQINDSMVTGQNPTVFTVKLNDGGLFRQHLMGDLLRTPNRQPQVEVFINGIPSMCSDNCGYTWSANQTPVINNITVSKDNNGAQLVLIINGTGFSNDNGNDTSSVKVGYAPCSIINISASEIRCLLQPSSAGTLPVQVYIAGIGFAESSLNFTIQTTISSVSPSSVSRAGGTIVTITGSGFGGNSLVQIGTSTCDVLYANTTTIQCQIQPGEQSEGDVNVTVLTNEITATLEDAFTYSSSSTPTITQISSNTSSVLGGKTLTIIGSDFGNESPNSLVVIGNIPCGILQWSITNITCLLPANLPGIYSLLVMVENLGFASVSLPDQSSISYILEVNDIQTKFGSLHGGTKITLSGSGFSTDLTQNTVKIGTVPCSITSASENELKCIIASPANVYTVTNNGQDLTNGIGYAWLPARLDILLGDTVVWQWQSQLFVTGVGYRVFSVSDPSSITYDGDTFTSGDSKTPSGVFKYQFNTPGTYYYSSGYVDDANTIFLQGVIVVSPVQNHSERIYVSVSNFEANYNQALEPPLNTALDSCLAPEPTCPQLLDVSTNDSISFGFHNSSYADQNSIICNIDPENAMLVGIAELVSLTVDNYGKLLNTMAKEMDRRFALLPHIDFVSPNNGSTTGYTRLTIHGSGFSDTNGSTVVSGYENILVYVGDWLLDVTSLNDTDIECDINSIPAGNYSVRVIVLNKGLSTGNFTITSPADATLLTSSGSTEGGHYSVSKEMVFDPLNTTSWSTRNTITINGTGFGSDATRTSVTIGKVTCTVVSIQILRYSALLVIVPEDLSPSYFGGGLVITLTGSGFDQLNSQVFVCNSECTVDRIQSTSNSLFCVTPTQNDISLVSVSIAKTNCTVQSLNDTCIICVTGEHSPSQQAMVQVMISGQGFARMDNAGFFYIDVWSSIYTWGGETPPDEGSLAVITQGQTILLDQSTPVLKMLLIQGGSLMFDEADIELQAENILITDGGLLQVGTEAAPFQHKAIITLHGHLRSPELPVYGAKTLAVRHGTLDLHGQPVPVTWTRLAQTAEAGSSILILQKSVTWKAGDEIVIASTGHRHSQNENEKMTIQSVSPDGTNVTLTQPLTYKHLGISVTLPDNSVFEARAEVGLLTRNILVRGSNNVEWSDKIQACPDGFDTGEFAIQTCFQGRFGEEVGSDQFGGCIMFHAPQPDQLMSIGRIEYVEVFHAGQAFRLGRYPIHWHLMGDVQFKSYVRGCGIHQTYNRAVTIHNTHHLLVENTVIYDIMGGAFFIEDGIEHGNVLQYNLAVFVRQSTSLLNDDVTPAGFWVTNPNNTIRHNAAAGGTHFGFWYRMHDNPDGPSYDPNICQKRIPLGEFYNNTVHSQGWFGIWIFEEYYPKVGGSCNSNTPQPAVFNSLTTWNCQKGAEWVNGGAVQFHNFTMVNNQDAGIETKRVLSPHVGGWGEQIGALIKNAKIVGHVDELGLGAGYCTAKGIVLPFDEGLTVSSVKFMNFDRPSCASIGVTSIDGLCVDRCGGWSAKFEGVQYYNSPNKAGFRWEHEVVLIDMDGTLTGTIGNKVVPGSGLLDPSQCSVKNDWSVGFPGFVCNATTRFQRLAFNNPTPSSLLGKDVILSNSFGISVVPFLSKRLTHKPGWMALLPSTNMYNWYFHDADFITNITYQSTFYGLKNQDYVIIKHNFTQRADMFTIIDQRNGSLQPLSWDNNTNGDWFFNDNTTTLTYLVSGKRRLQKRAVAGMLDPDMVNVDVNLQVINCFFKNCIPPPPVPPGNGSSNTHYWSNRTFWETSVENNYTVPNDGSNVVIPIDKWVIADVNIPYLEKLIIYGVLEMKNLTDSSSSARSGVIYKTTVLNATYISIQGGRLIAGYENDPFQGELQIILRGNHLTPEMPLPDGPNQGSKVLGVFGQLDLHGLPYSVYKTKLATTISAGGQNITLVEAVDWKVGDDILITTTSYNAWQTEIREIIAISPDMKTLTLNLTLTYTHIAKSYQVPNSSLNYTMAADVALLTRNIKIIGQDYPGWYQESFGARVLVSTFTDVAEFTGSAKIENVEFYHTGQEGYRDPTDPRYSLAFLDLGEIPENSSYVRGCAFHNGFSPAIGVFSTNGLDVDDNVIHYTVGEGIRVWGERVRLRRNLVALAIWPGSYQDRAEQNNILWHAGIEINEGSDIVLQDNVVAGFERVGYRINGEPCTGESNPSVEWLNNEAYGGLYGVYMNQDGLPGCSLIRRFKLWKCFDYGIYVQSTESVKITESVFVDNGMGIFTIVYTPAATSHQTSDKTATISNSLFVGSSPDFNCSDTLTNSDANIRISAEHRSTRPIKGGRSGICWPAFVSSHNMAPGDPHAGLMSYNTISGVMTVTDSTFVGYKTVCSTESNVVFITNPLNEDLQHPIEVSGINMIDVSEDQKVFIHRPDLSKANPSDCVDMTCDAKKKSLLKDLDGSFLGSRGSVVPQSEYQWNGDASYGLGDYRIPKVILTRLNGSRIPVSEVAPNKGIIRDSSCVYMSAWESYKCFGLNYEMLVIESLDSDTETRRLSPVAVLGSGYIDLINGPQDHGWCSGYTCQKRVSLFHSIVTTNMSFDVYFTSTSPQKLRLILLNVDNSKAVRVGIYYSDPQRLDVYVNNSYVIPTNGQLKSNGDIAYNDPTYAGQYMPNLNSTVNGDNYFDPVYNMLYILVRGSTPVEIRTTPLIVVSFKLPAMTADQFYGDNLVRNLALFLKIPNDKIRITKIIAEGGRRRKRATGGLTVMMEIADPPNQSTNTSTNSTGALSYSNFQNMSQSLAAAAVSGSLSSFLNVTVGSMSVSTPVPSPSDPAWSAMANQTVDRNQGTDTGSYLSTVTMLSVIVQPIAGIPGNVFFQQPVVKALDSNGNCVSVSSSSLTLSVHLKDSMNNYVDSGLGGSTTIPFIGCWANYTDLVLKLAGSGYKLEFVLSSISGQTDSFDSRAAVIMTTTDSSTAAPATTAPSTTAPATTAPSTTAPATTAPSTTAPSTAAPATTAPSTAAPATTALAFRATTVILNPPSGSETINIYSFSQISVLLIITLAGMFLNLQ